MTMGMSEALAKALNIDLSRAKVLSIRLPSPAQSGEGKAPPKTRHPAPPDADDDGLNKLERAFFEAATAAARRGDIGRVMAHPIKLRVIGPKYYIPDFVVVDHDGGWCIFETKGFMREDAELKLIAAAERYPEWRWTLTRRVNRRWECRCVTAAGISKGVWRPDWLS